MLNRIICFFMGHKRRKRVEGFLRCPRCRAQEPVKPRAAA